MVFDEKYVFKYHSLQYKKYREIIMILKVLNKNDLYNHNSKFTRKFTIALSL